MTRPVTLAVCAALALGGAAMAGCGGSSSSSSSSTSGSSGSASTSTGTSQPSSGGGSTVNVQMKNIKFIPATINVKVGQTIKWTNNDPVTHTVTAKSGATFDSQVNAGKTFTFKPTKAGKIHYVCTIHPGQQGDIVVTG